MAVACVVLAITVVLPAPDGMTPAAKNLAGLFVMALILWTTEALPIAITALVIVLLHPLLRIATLPAAAASFTSQVFFFVLTMFCIAQVVNDSGLARRFALALLTRAGSDSRRVVLAFMVGTAVMSMIVSDVPVTAVWMSMALLLLHRIGAAPGQSRFAKALMIGIPVAALIGGVGTPAGSSINVLGLFQIEQFGKVHVSFVQWMVIGIPMVIILIPIAWAALVWYFPPEMATIGKASDIEIERRSLGPMTASEKRVVLLVGTMIALWILSSWVRQIDTTLVAMAGAIAMFAPGVNLLTWPRAQRTIGWDALLLIGSITCLGSAASTTGLAKNIVGALPDMQDWSPAATVALISTLTILIHLPVPIGPAIVALLIPPIALLALETGHNPALYTLPVVFTASCGMLLPIDAVVIITYAKGYFRMTEMFIPGAIISVAWVIVMTALMMIFAPFLGLG
jgi:sodium-dependent dicarboxylate transporter 2/3/5